MHTPKSFTLALLLSAATLTAAGDGRKPIGMVMAPGTFTIDNLPASGTATVFDGDRVVTGTVGSRIHLSAGTDVMLAPESSGTIYIDHVVVNSGTATGSGMRGFGMQANNLILHATDDQTTATVQVASDAVRVAVPSGHADVATTSGMLMSHMAPGAALSYATIAHPVPAMHVQIWGVLDRQNSHYLLRDRTSNIVSELTGEIPADDHDRLVTVTGDLAPGGSEVPYVDQVVNVTKVERSSATSAVPCVHDGAGGVAKRVALRGPMQEENNHFLLTNNSDHRVYDVLGDVKDSDAGNNANIKGFVLASQRPVAPAQEVVYAENRRYIPIDSPCAGLVAGGMMVTAWALTLPKTPAVAEASRPISF